MTDLLEVCADLPELQIAPGGVLIAEQSPPGAMFVLVDGSVTIERTGVPFARIDTPGAIFGEMSAVLGRPATATARARTVVRVRVIEDPTRFLTERPGAALAVLRMTASRLDGMTQYLVDVKSQFAEAPGTHLGMVERILDSLLHHQGPAPQTGSARDPEG